MARAVGKVLEMRSECNRQPSLDLWRRWLRQGFGQRRQRFFPRPVRRRTRIFQIHTDRPPSLNRTGRSNRQTNSVGQGRLLTPGAELGALAKYFHGMTPIDSTSGDWNSRLLPMADHASSEEFKMRPLHAIAITVLVSTLAMADVRTHEPVSEQQSRG